MLWYCWGFWVHFEFHHILLLHKQFCCLENSCLSLLIASFRVSQHYYLKLSIITFLVTLSDSQLLLFHTFPPLPHQFLKHSILWSLITQCIWPSFTVQQQFACTQVKLVTQENSYHFGSMKQMKGLVLGVFGCFLVGWWGVFFFFVLWGLFFLVGCFAFKRIQ